VLSSRAEGGSFLQRVTSLRMGDEAARGESEVMTGNVCRRYTSDSSGIRGMVLLGLDELLGTHLL